MKWSISLSILLTFGQISCSTSKKELGPKSIPIEIDSMKRVDSPAFLNGGLNDSSLARKELSPEAFSLNLLLDSISGLQGYKVFTQYKTYALKGDFYGDGTEDMALLIEKDDMVNLCIINFNNGKSFYIFGEKDKPEDYSWAGVFEKVNAGDALWSNYVDDFRSFEDVPDTEKVVLPYDAIYAHALESCGGGFIFWKDGKFNWLQQE